MSKNRSQDRRIVDDVLAAKPLAWERLVERTADTVWNACAVLAGAEDDCRDAFAFVYRSLGNNGFHRLRAYDGSSRLESYVALVCRDVLAERLLALFHSQPAHAGWRAFEAFFKRDIDRLIKRRISATDRVDVRLDAYQDICASLISDDFRRLKAYQGQGSFAGFILHSVDRLLIDFIRRLHPKSKPAEVTLPDDSQFVDDRNGPEDLLLEKEAERLLEEAADALKQASQRLTDVERVYIRITLGSPDALPAREIARLMAVPVEDVYKMKQRILIRLREEISKNSAVKKWRASV